MTDSLDTEIRRLVTTVASAAPAPPVAVELIVAEHPVPPIARHRRRASLRLALMAAGIAIAGTLTMVAVNDRTDTHRTVLAEPREPVTAPSATDLPSTPASPSTDSSSPNTAIDPTSAASSSPVSTAATALAVTTASPAVDSPERSSPIVIPVALPPGYHLRGMQELVHLEGRRIRVLRPDTPRSVDSLVVVESFPRFPGCAVPIAPVAGRAASRCSDGSREWISVEFGDGQRAYRPRGDVSLDELISVATSDVDDEVPPGWTVTAEMGPTTRPKPARRTRLAIERDSGPVEVVDSNGGTTTWGIFIDIFRDTVPDDLWLLAPPEIEPMEVAGLPGFAVTGERGGAAVYWPAGDGVIAAVSASDLDETLQIAAALQLEATGAWGWLVDAADGGLPNVLVDTTSVEPPVGLVGAGSNADGSILYFEGGNDMAGLRLSVGVSRGELDTMFVATDDVGCPAVNVDRAVGRVLVDQWGAPRLVWQLEPGVLASITVGGGGRPSMILAPTELVALAETALVVDGQEWAAAASSLPTPIPLPLGYTTVEEWQASQGPHPTTCPW